LAPNPLTGRRSKFAIVATLTLGAAACAGSSTHRAEQPVVRRHPTTTTTAVPGQLTMPAGLGAPVAVTRVVDGDTIKVSTGQTIRLIGIDTPETKDPRKPVQCFGVAASNRAHALLDGASVRLEYDPTQGRLDKYGRTLAYVWMPDGRLYNQVIIAEGYAHQYTYDLPYRYRDAFLAAERSARENDRGLWSPSTCAGDTTQPARAGALPTTSTAPTAPASAACDPSYPDVCIPPPPPDLDCADIPYRRFRVVGPDPDRFDSDHDGIGCE
jgi:micrococcal nuclease